MERMLNLEKEMVAATRSKAAPDHASKGFL
jgi:hypothetical protein